MPHTPLPAVDLPDSLELLTALTGAASEVISMDAWGSRSKLQSQLEAIFTQTPELQKQFVEYALRRDLGKVKAWKEHSFEEAQTTLLEIENTLNGIERRLQGISRVIQSSSVGRTDTIYGGNENAKKVQRFISKRRAGIPVIVLDSQYLNEVKAAGTLVGKNLVGESN